MEKRKDENTRRSLTLPGCLPFDMDPATEAAANDCVLQPRVVQLLEW